MAKINLTKEEKAGLIEALSKGVEPSPELLPKLFPGTAEKFDVQAQASAPCHFRMCVALMI